MNRSFVNDVLLQADAFIRQFGFVLPPFAYWSPDRMRGGDGDMIRARRLGWDITDYGEGRFDKLGLFLFTLRNGDAADLARGRGMLYAEKLLISRVDQLSPMHRHTIKSEDIINRGGGRLVLELFASDPDGASDPDAGVRVLTDGRERRLAAGAHLSLDPGESVTLMPGDWHAFWAEDADCLIGEVSTVNDDRTDNIFARPIDRFATITDDEPPVHLLVSDY